MIIRDETSGDRAAVYRVVEAAFGQPDEARLIQALQAAGDTVVSLVAEADGAVVGHVMLSKMSAPFRALALAPVSVAPARQNAGIGSALVPAVIGRARQAGYEAIFVLGDPRYYARFGFDLATAAGFSSPYAGEHFMGMALTALPTRVGVLAYAPAFADLD